jgi:hypothetical protein
MSAAAFSTSGIPPPRAFLSVAILLMFTLSRVIVKVMKSARVAARQS